MKEKWEELYSKKFNGVWVPSEGFVKFSARYLQRRIGVDAYDMKRKVGRILDAGCGVGRHVVFFAEQGYDVYGMDISKEAIEIGKAWLVKKKLNAKMMAGSIEQLPFKNEYFNVVLSHGVLDHLDFATAKQVMTELKRVLVPDGYIFISLRSTDDSEFSRGKKMGHNTLLLEGGYEKGVIQHYFDLNELKEILNGFRVFDIELHEERFPKIFTIHKAFLQSSRGIKKDIDLSKPINMDYKYSRWYIAAEKVQQDENPRNSPTSG